MAASSSSSCHVRSISLPWTSHPILARVEECLNFVKRWSEASASKKRQSLKAGLNHLTDLHISSIDFLQLPLTRQSLGGKETLLCDLMDVFVNLLDVCGMVKDCFSHLREQYQHLSSLVRRNNCNLHKSIGIYECLRRRMRKDMIKCQRSLKSSRKNKAFEDEGLVFDILTDVINSTISMFKLLIPTISGQKTPLSALSKLRFMGSKKSDKSNEDSTASEIERLDTVLYAIYSSEDGREENIKAAEGQMVGSDIFLRETEIELDGLFRCLIKFRASLLNILTGC